MCGIAGIFDLNARRGVDRETLYRMTRSLDHRGPDGEGYHCEPGVGLGHRRLAIIDLEGGKQPLFNEDDSVAVTYNGEIYNFQYLQKDLMARGHRFRTRCDTEVIVHAWEEWGEACVDRFHGMFAFAIFDRTQQCLFLARDRLGIKPLYYNVTCDGFLLFGSELKAILEHPSARRELDPQSVEDYFAFGYVPDPKTILKGISKLPPGHTLRAVKGESLPPTRLYWDVSFNEEDKRSDGELHEQITAGLSASVKKRLIAEVPLGAFLSGGVDSSSVVAMMSKLSSTTVNTMCISFGDPAFNESRYAELVAHQYQTNHTVNRVEPGDFALVRSLGGIYDEPFADSSAIPTYRVCELARRNVTVALSGDGGDENFIGYRRYRWHAYEERIRNVLPRRLRKTVFGTLGALYPRIDWAPKVFRAKATLQGIARDSVEGYLHSVSISTDAIRRQIFNTDFRRELNGYEAIEVFRYHAAKAPRLSGVKLAQYLDFKTYLPGDILTKVDRASMAHGLEVRVPILDHEYVETVARIPVAKKLVGSAGKHCFKKALEPFLPSEILYRRKMGFGVPLASWLRGPLRSDVASAVRKGGIAQSGVFDLPELKKLVDEHQRGTCDHSAVLWALLMFDGSFGALFGRD